MLMKKFQRFRSLLGPCMVWASVRAYRGPRGIQVVKWDRQEVRRCLYDSERAFDPARVYVWLELRPCTHRLERDAINRVRSMSFGDISNEFVFGISISLGPQYIWSYVQSYTGPSEMGILRLGNDF